MVDVVDKATRSRMMSGIRAKDTKPEILWRRMLHKEGLRFQLHRRDLSGKPDLVFPRHHVALFVNGCFWHGHECRIFKWPKTRVQFWQNKIQHNRDRDLRVIEDLEALGWRCLVAWECALRGATEATIAAAGKSVAKWIRDGAGSAQLSGAI